MLSLRTSDGLDLDAVAARFGERSASVLQAALQQKSKSGLVVPAGQGQRWRLSDPEGFLLSNSVISDLFALLDDSKVSDCRQRQRS